MTITKKTRLLAKPLKKVRITSFGMVRYESSYDIHPDIENPEAVVGYEMGEDCQKLNAELIVNDVSKGTVTLDAPPIKGQNSFNFQSSAFGSGDRVRFVLHINPAMTEFDQNDVVHEFVAE